MKIKHIKFSVEQIEEAVEEVLNLKAEVERELGVDETEQPEGESTIME